MKRAIFFGLFSTALVAGMGIGGVPVGNGDVNGDGKLDISDAVYLLSGLFLGGPQPVAIECPPPGHVAADGPIGNGDVNGDRKIDISDAVYLLSALFTGGAAPKEITCEPSTSGTGLPDTGQTKCYMELEGQWVEAPCESVICTGQDGAYATGCPMEGRFVDNGDGTVSDTCTGLIWQKETADVDRDGQIGDGDRVRWQGALQYCENLTFAGHDDWRLPNVRELQSIVDYGHSNPAIDSVFGAVSSTYLSSTPGFPPWLVDFTSGSMLTGGDAFSGGSHYVRGVRGGSDLPTTGKTKCYDAAGAEIDCARADFPGQDGFYKAGCPSEGRFVDNADGTVTDNCTGLMWQKDTADVNGDGQVDRNDEVIWCDALAYCDSLSFAGHDDWRLPNVRELQSIVDYGRSDPAIAPVFGSLSSAYWSSTSGAFLYRVGWFTGFLDGSIGGNLGGFEGRPHSVRAVRNATVAP